MIKIQHDRIFLTALLAFYTQGTKPCYYRTPTIPVVCRFYFSSQHAYLPHVLQTSGTMTVAIFLSPIDRLTRTLWK